MLIFALARINEPPPPLLPVVTRGLLKYERRARARLYGCSELQTLSARSGLGAILPPALAFMARRAAKNELLPARRDTGNE